MRRYGKSRRSEGEELDALRRPGSRTIRRKRRTKVVPTVLGVLLVLGVLGAIFVIYSAAMGEEGGRQGPVEVEVVEGDTLSEVAAKLESAGVIRSAFVFEMQARYEGYGTRIQTGRYTFERGQ